MMNGSRLPPSPQNTLCCPINLRLLSVQATAALLTLFVAREGWTMKGFETAINCGRRSLKVRMISVGKQYKEKRKEHKKSHKRVCEKLFLFTNTLFGHHDFCNKKDRDIDQHRDH